MLHTASPVRLSPILPDDTLEADVIVGESDALRYVMFRVEQVASTDATVLLSAKRAPARSWSRARSTAAARGATSPFVVVNCAAMPATLIESELFGRERGAFTGAHTAQIGRFELRQPRHDLPRRDRRAAARGAAEAAARPAGRADRAARQSAHGRRRRPRRSPPPTATCRKKSREGRFRRDLFYRLNVFPITLPALRAAARGHPAARAPSREPPRPRRCASASTAFPTT